MLTMLYLTTLAIHYLPAPLFSELDLHSPLIHIVNKNDAEFHRQHGLLFWQGRAFTGVTNDYYDSGQFKDLAIYRNGKRHGLQLTLYPSGQAAQLRFYINGRKHGLHLGWWTNAQQQFEHSFQYGLLDGSSREWHENGRLARVGYYRHGREEGLQRGWQENGERLFGYVYKNGRRYGVLGSRPCFTVYNDQQPFVEIDHVSFIKQ